MQRRTTIVRRMHHIQPDERSGATGKSLIVLNPWLSLGQRLCQNPVWTYLSFGNAQPLRQCTRSSDVTASDPASQWIRLVAGGRAGILLDSVQVFE